MKKYFFLSVAVALAFAGCARDTSHPLSVAPGHLPLSWHQLPEQGGAMASTDGDEDLDLAELKAGPAVDQILESTATALDQAALESPSGISTQSLGLSEHPKDYTPWHAEYFLTDLSVSIQGMLGLLMKGSPSVALHWRRQGPAPIPSSVPEPTLASDLLISDDTSPEEIAAQLEPVIRATVAAGKVKDERGFREQALAAALDFRSMVTGLSQNPGLGYWPSRFRLDLTVEASTGKLIPVVSVGADTRLRFEWHRGLRKKKPAMLAVSVPMSERARQLRDFVTAMSYDIASVADSYDNLHGFKAYGFRTGIGLTLKGEVGIWKGGAGAAGHVYFSRDVKKPTVRPAMFHDVAFAEYLPIIAAQPTKATSPHAGTEKYAAAHGISFMKAKEEIVYQVDRGKFRKGLKRAAKMAAFFTERAAKAKSRHWKVYELRTGFELSVSGDLALVGVTGQAMTEVSFYNQGF